MRVLGVRYWLQKQPELIEHLTREDDAGCAHGQASNAQCLRRPSVAGMTEVVGSGRGMEDALRKGAGRNTAWKFFLIDGQIVPQKLRQTSDAPPATQE